MDALQDIAAIDKAFLASTLDVLKKLEDSRYHKRPVTRKLEGVGDGNILEARVMGGSQRMLARFPFVYQPGAVVIILYGFTKGFESSPSNFISQAIQYRNLLNEGKATYEPIIFPK